MLELQVLYYLALAKEIVIMLLKTTVLFSASILIIIGLFTCIKRKRGRK